MKWYRRIGLRILSWFLPKGRERILIAPWGRWWVLEYPDGLTGGPFTLDVALDYADLHGGVVRWYSRRKEKNKETEEVIRDN